MNFVDAQIQKSILYYGDNGVFANIAQVGMTPSSGNDEVTDSYTDPATFPGPYVSYMAMTPGVSGCPSVAVIAALANFDGANVTVTNQGKYLYVQKYIIEINQIAQQQCYYNAFNATTSGLENLSGNFLDNCINLTDFPNANDAATNAIASCP